MESNFINQMRHICTTTKTFEDRESFDGQHQTWELPDNWDFIPLHLKDRKNVTIKNLVIHAGKDQLHRIAGLLTIENCENIIIENLELKCCGDDGGKSQICFGCYNSKNITIKNCEFSYSPKSHNIEFFGCHRFKLIDCESHHAYLDGIKVHSSNIDTTIERCYSHHNGRTWKDNGAAGDGIDLTQGACGSTNLIANTLGPGNTNGITFKYGAWGEGERDSVFGVNILGGSLSGNGTGLFAQGYAGADNATGACDGRNAPYPMGFNVCGVLAQENKNHGFLIGHGSWNLDKCIAYKNGGHGVYCTSYSKKCVIRDLLSVANSDSNMNLWGPDTDVDHARCYGIDIFTLPEISWRNKTLPSITKYGINYQWKPARGKHHGVFRRCLNKYSKEENGKPAHLPDKNWLEPYEE